MLLFVCQKMHSQISHSPNMELPRATQDLYADEEEGDPSPSEFVVGELNADKLRSLIVTEAQQYVEDQKSKWNAVTQERIRRLVREAQTSSSRGLFNDLDADNSSETSPVEKFSFPDDQDIFEIFPPEEVVHHRLQQTDKPTEPSQAPEDSSGSGQSSTIAAEIQHGKLVPQLKTRDDSPPQFPLLTSGVSEKDSKEYQNHASLGQSESSTISDLSIPQKEASMIKNELSVKPFPPTAVISKANEELLVNGTSTAREISLSSKQHFIQKYEHYNALFLAAKSAFPTLENDASYKTLKSAVLFASSNPVSICSGNSPMEIIAPYRKAFMLLRGKEVETPTLRICLSNHPEIIHYVRFNMAKKFVDLAAKQIEETNEKKLFALATLITELWACDRELGEIFLSCLYQELPILIPYYGKSSIKTSGNLDLEFKKMSALTKFYAAIMQTDRSFLLRRLFPQMNFKEKNPHGMEAAWEFLSGLLNLEIQVATTVIVIGSFLRVSGWLLQRTYGKQFSKIIMCISRYVLPKIKEKTPKEFVGPVERLAMLLDNFHRDQIFPIPDNRLSEEFWFSL